MSDQCIKCSDGEEMTLREFVQPALESKSFLENYWCLPNNSDWKMPLNIAIIVYYSWTFVLLLYCILLSIRKLKKVKKYNIYDWEAKIQT